MRQHALFVTGNVGETIDKEGIETEPADGTREKAGGRTVNPVVSPLANLSLRETCAYCGREIRAAGRIIPDFEELGAFCSQECADRRFRVYLTREA
jgi:hypothetical protein